MRFIVTAILAFLGYVPATHEMMSSAFYSQLLALHALAPDAASVAGIGVIWPAIFMAGCYGLASGIVGALSGPRWYSSNRSPFGGREQSATLSTETPKR